VAGQQSIQYGDVYFAGNVGFKSVTIPVESIGDAHIKPLAGIDHTKVIHKHAIRYAQKAGAAVVAETVGLHIAAAEGQVLAIEAILATPPGTGDSVTIDLKAGNTATAYASILSAALALDDTSTARTVYSAAIGTPEYEDGDSLELVVTVSGSTAQGLTVIVWVAENPQ
jgi:hypothetical protein